MGTAGHRKGVVDKEEPMIGPKPASAAERKAQAAEEARERSDRILEEERAKDKAWRQAVLMVSAQLTLMLVDLKNSMLVFRCCSCEIHTSRYVTLRRLGKGGCQPKGEGRGGGDASSSGAHSPLMLPIVI